MSIDEFCNKTFYLNLAFFCQFSQFSLIGIPGAGQPQAPLLVLVPSMHSLSWQYSWRSCRAGQAHTRRMLSL